jgi:pyruvate,water dikinase
MLGHQLCDVVAPAYRELAERCAALDFSVAVRSSAIDEDSREASFAGQYETCLNVVGADAVAKEIARCWAAARSGRV